MNLKSSLPLIIALLLITTILSLTFVKCNKAPVLNPDIQRLEVLEREKKELIEKYNTLLQAKIDTVYIERTRIKVKNDNIFIYQSDVGNLPKDSAAKLLISWTSKPSIKD